MRLSNEMWAGQDKNFELIIKLHTAAETIFLLGIYAADYILVPSLNSPERFPLENAHFPLF